MVKVNIAGRLSVSAVALIRGKFQKRKIFPFSTTETDINKYKTLSTEGHGKDSFKNHRNYIGVGLGIAICI